MQRTLNGTTTYGELIPGDVVVYESDRSWRGVPRSREVVRLVEVVQNDGAQWMGRFDNDSTVATTPDAKIRIVGHVMVGV